MQTTSPITTSLDCTLYFPPEFLPSSPGQAALTIARVLVIDPEKKDIQIHMILGMPPDIPAPAKYRINAEVRAKGQGKPGFNFWYQSHQKLEQQK